MSRLVSIGLIVLAASVGWFALGGTLVDRTRASDDTLTGAVSNLWGPPESQSAPILTLARGKSRESLAPTRSRIDVTLDLDERRKGLL